MAELKTLTIDGTSNSINAGDYIKHDADGISIPFKFDSPSQQSVSLPNGTFVDALAWTAPEDCLAWVSYWCAFSANTTGSRQSRLLDNNRVAMIANNKGLAANSGTTVHTGSETYKMLSGNKIYLQMWQNSGSTLGATFGFEIRYIPVVGGVIRRLLNALKPLSFRLERGCA